MMKEQYNKKISLGYLKHLGFINNDGPILMFDGEIITIFKYARPQDKSPIRDTLRCLRRLRRGDFKHIHIDKRSIVDCLVVGVLTETLKEQAEDMNLRNGGDGFYGFHQNLGAFIHCRWHRPTHENDDGLAQEVEKGFMSQQECEDIIGVKDENK